MASLNETRIQRFKRRVKTAGKFVGGGVLAAEIAGASAVAGAEPQRPPAIIAEGQMPSLNSPITVFSREQSVAVNPAVSREYVQPIAVESVQQAANLFGADAYSKDPDHWKINEFGGATLKPDSSGQVHRVRANGAVVEGWIKIKKNGEHQAQTLVARPRDTKKLDINGGTFWRAPKGKEKELWAQVREQVKAKEKKTQPDVDIVPVCKPGDKEVTRWVNPKRIPSRKYAAKTYGLDAYSRNWRNWRINSDGSATLKEDPSGLEHEVSPANGVLTLWNKVDRVSGYDAIAGVAVQLGHGLYAKGVTAYLPKDAGDRGALFYQLFRQTVKREAKEQPGILVLPYCN